MNFSWLPWTRQNRPDPRDEIAAGLLLGGAAEPPIDQLGDLQAACRLYGTVLATAAPDAGPLTPWLLFDCGFRLGLRGRWVAMIEVEADGGLKLTPFDAWPHRGVWIGSTRERDGLDSRNLSVPADAVFRVELPGGAPMPLLSSTASIAHATDRSVAKDAAQPVGQVIGLGDQFLNSGPQARRDILDNIRESTGTIVTPTGVFPGGRYGGDPPDSMIKLRDQLRRQVEAHFGIMGLLSDMDGTAVHALWRVSVVRTFETLARLLEIEAANKLDNPEWRLNRDAWIAAPHSELARSATQRASGVDRLVRAGVSVDAAREAMGV